MYRLYYQHPNTWFGDCMPFGKNGKFYLFHQRDTRRPGPFGEPFGWSLATTTDFVHYEDHGIAIEPGGNDEQDQFIYAGSVFEAEGKYHALYTGYNRTYGAKGKNPQVLMKATSTDLFHWEKSPEKLVEPQPGYDPKDWRDPFVLWEKEQGEYVMILGARKAGKRIMSGCTVWFTSKDLRNWQFQGDFWAPNMFPMHEMPDLFKMGDWWYLLISEYGRILYRRSKSLNGPWLAPPDDGFDGRAYYAGRTAFDGKRRILFGWVRTRETWDDEAQWCWGGTFVPHEIYQRPDGTLGCKIPDTVQDAFKESRTVAENLLLTSVDGSREVVLTEIQDKFCKFEAKVKFHEGIHGFGLRINEDVATGDSYEFHFPVEENRYTFCKSPGNYTNGTYPNRVTNQGLERPIALKSETEYTIQLIVDGDIATLYVDGVALNVRMYNAKGNKISFYVVEGSLEIVQAGISGQLKR